MSYEGKEYPVIGLSGSNHLEPDLAWVSDRRRKDYGTSYKTGTFHTSHDSILANHTLLKVKGIYLPNSLQFITNYALSIDRNLYPRSFCYVFIPWSVKRIDRDGCYNRSFEPQEIILVFMQPKDRIDNCTVHDWANLNFIEKFIARLFVTLHLG